MTQRGLLEPPDDQTAVVVSIPSWYKPWLCAATDDSRPALTGVHIDPAGYAIAADGFMAAIVPCTITTGQLYDGDFAGALIPADFLKRARKANGKAPYLNIEISGGRAVHRLNGDGSWASLVKAEFPNWRGLVPTSIGPAGGGNGVDLDLAMKVCEAVEGFPFRWYGGRDKYTPIVVKGAENAFGLLMPMQCDDPTEELLKATAPFFEGVRKSR